MYLFWTILLIFLCSFKMNLAINCLVSKNIECTCDDDSVSCNGIQQEYLEVQDILANISSIYSSKDLLYLKLDIRNLTFPPGLNFMDFKLKNLTIGTDLQNIHDDLFLGLSSSLRSLSLQNNNIPFINKQSFSQLFNLKDLILYSNEIYEISPNAFFNLSNLESLNLSQNKLYQLDSNVLENLLAIQELVLTNNNFSSLSNINIVSPTLKKIVAQNCTLNGSVTADFLSGASNLEMADFSLNLLTSVESHAMSYLNQLKVLNLSNNQLEKLENNAFSSLHNLRTLDLRNNKLLLIKKTSFLNLTSLKYLDLSDNLLQAVLEEYTSDLYSLEHINLKNNNIKIIMPGTFSTNINLKKLSLIGNSWDCICELSNFVGFLLNNSHSIDFKEVENLKCASPPASKGTPIIEFDFTPLNCDYKEETEEDYDYESSETESTVPSITDPLTSTPELIVTTYLPSTTESPSPTTETELIVTTNSSSTTQRTIPVSPTTEEIKSTAANVSSTTIETSTSSTVLSTTEEIQLSSQEIGSTTDNIQISTKVILPVTPIQTTTQEITSTMQETSPPTTKTLLFSTNSTIFYSSTVPIILGSKSAPELSVTILEYSVLDKEFCLRWSLSGITSKPTCSIRLNTVEGSRSKMLKCPTDGNEIRQCITSKTVYEFCLSIYVQTALRNKVCNKIPVTSTQTLSTENTSIATEEITNVISTKATEETTFLSTNVTKYTTKSLSTTVSPKIHINPSVDFRVTSFDAIFHYSNYSALLTWTVSKPEPESICILTLILLTNQHNHTEGSFKCTNKSYQMLSIKEEDPFRICLRISHDSYKTNQICKFHSGLSYELKASKTKDSGYKNSSLIAVLCLFIVVSVIIILLVLKKLLKKRAIGDRYNVYAEEQNVKKRISRQVSQEPCVRYSYTPQEHI